MYFKDIIRGRLLIEFEIFEVQKNCLTAIKTYFQAWFLNLEIVFKKEHFLQKHRNHIHYKLVVKKILVLQSLFPLLNTKVLFIFGIYLPSSNLQGIHLIEAYSFAIGLRFEKASQDHQHT